jgi:hypothetical protein
MRDPALAMAMRGLPDCAGAYSTARCTMSDAFVSIHDFRKKLEEYLLYAEQPVVITRRQMPVAFFIPAKIWYGRGNEESFRKFVSVTLDAAGVSEQDVDDSIEKYVRSSADSIKKRLQHL